MKFRRAYQMYCNILYIKKVSVSFVKCCIICENSLLTLRSGPKVVPHEIYEKSPEKILLSCSALLCFVAILTFTILLL